MITPVKTALMVGHPGHELRVYHWMETHRPLMCCLTDGSGLLETPRMESAARLLAKVGGLPGPLFGVASDKQVYRHILDGRADFFASMVDSLAQTWIAAEIEMVAGDAAEGFNPTHDLCRWIVDAAVDRVKFLTGRQLVNYEFVLEARPDACPAHLRESAIWLQLDEKAIERKLAAALDYPELKAEVDMALKHFGVKAFALECLYPSNIRQMMAHWEHELPIYERHGRQRVGEGHYQTPIYYREHVLPIVSAIREAATARA
jgi:hypothetical protein